MRPACSSDEVADRDEILVLLGLGAPQHRAHAGDELAGRERLRHVVVGAELEPGDAVDLLVAGRHDHDRQARGAADRPAEVEAVGVRELQVEDREADVVLLERQQPFGAARRPDDAEPVLLEVGANERRDVLLVLDEQDRPAPRRSAAGHAPARLSTLTTVAGASAAWVTATCAPGRASCRRAGAPWNLKRVPASSARVTLPPPARRSVIAVFEIAVTMPRSVVGDRRAERLDHEGVRPGVVHDAGDEPGTNVGDRRAGCR